MREWLPRSTADHRTINDDHIDGAFYLDGSFAYRLGEISRAAGGALFLNVKNAFDTDPPVVAPGPGGVAFVTAPNNPTFYDYLGRVFFAGARIRM